MDSLPLHPAVVHLPLGIAFITPFLAAGISWAIATERLPKRAWLIVVVLLAAIVGGGVASLKTGEMEEDRAEKIVAKALIHEHEDAAEAFAWSAGAVLAAALCVAFLPLGRIARWGMALVTVATLLLAALGARAGHMGGELVYVHGAAGSPSAAPSNPDHD